MLVTCLKCKKPVFVSSSVVAAGDAEIPCNACGTALVIAGNGSVRLKVPVVLPVVGSAKVAVASAAESVKPRLGFGSAGKTEAFGGGGGSWTSTTPPITFEETTPPRANIQSTSAPLATPPLAEHVPPPPPADAALAEFAPESPPNVLSPPVVDESLASMAASLESVLPPVSPSLSVPSQPVEDLLPPYAVVSELVPPPAPPVMASPVVLESNAAAPNPVVVAPQPVVARPPRPVAAPVAPPSTPPRRTPVPTPRPPARSPVTPFEVVERSAMQPSGSPVTIPDDLPPRVGPNLAAFEAALSSAAPETTKHSATGLSARQEPWTVAPTATPLPPAAAASAMSPFLPDHGRAGTVPLDAKAFAREARRMRRWPIAAGILIPVFLGAGLWAGNLLPGISPPWAGTGASGSANPPAVNSPRELGGSTTAATESTRVVNAEQPGETVAVVAAGDREAPATVAADGDAVDNEFMGTKTKKAPTKGSKTPGKLSATPGVIGTDVVTSPLSADTSPKTEPKSAVVLTPAPPPPPGPPQAATASPADLHYQQGNLYLKEKKVALAIEEFKKCLVADSNYGVAYRSLGVAYMLLGREKSAIESYEKFVGVVPGHRDVPKVREIIADYYRRNPKAP